LLRKISQTRQRSLKPQDDPGNARSGNVNGRVFLKAVDREEQCRKENALPPAEEAGQGRSIGVVEGSADHRKPGGGKEPGGGGAEAGKNRLDYPVFLEAGEHAGHDNNDDDRRAYQPKRGNDAPCRARAAEARVNRHVDPYRAGGELGRRHEVGDQIRGQPGVDFRQLVEKRQGRQSPANGKEAYLEEFPKKDEKDHAPLFLFFGASCSGSSLPLCPSPSPILSAGTRRCR